MNAVCPRWACRPNPTGSFRESRQSREFDSNCETLSGSTKARYTEITEAGGANAERTEHRETHRLVSRAPREHPLWATPPRHSGATSSRLPSPRFALRRAAVLAAAHVGREKKRSTPIGTLRRCPAPPCPLWAALCELCGKNPTWYPPYLCHPRSKKCLRLASSAVWTISPLLPEFRGYPRNCRNPKGQARMARS